MRTHGRESRVSPVNVDIARARSRNVSKAIWMHRRDTVAAVEQIVSKNWAGKRDAYNVGRRRVRKSWILYHIYLHRCVFDEFPSDIPWRAPIVRFEIRSWRGPRFWSTPFFVYEFPRDGKKCVDRFTLLIIRFCIFYQPSTCFLFDSKIIKILRSYYMCISDRNHVFNVFVLLYETNFKREAHSAVSLLQLRRDRPCVARPRVGASIDGFDLISDEKY